MAEGSSPGPARARVENVVATASLGGKIDLAEVSQKAPNSELNTGKGLPGVTMRLKEPKVTAHIAGSGEIRVMGAKSEADAHLAARKVCALLKHLGCPVKKVKNYQVVNILATAALGYAVNLRSLADEHSLFASYHPDVKPGATYRMQNPKVTITLYTTGSMTMAGATSEEAVAEAFRQMQEIAAPHKIQGPPQASGHPE